MAFAIQTGYISLSLATHGQHKMNWLKNLFNRKPKQVNRGFTAKQIATEKGEPWVEIKSIDFNFNDPGQGSFALDWNDKFVANLVRAGYQMRPDDSDADIVDRWFTEVCRNVVLETYEQEQAMNPNRPIKSRDLGDGFSESY